MTITDLDRPRARPRGRVSATTRPIPTRSWSTWSCPRARCPGACPPTRPAGTGPHSTAAKYARVAAFVDLVDEDTDR
ncbi:hypothetical protein ACLQ24_29920 [Micromonospora sp. DT4]|uniref:hypothetical protein n=1 Tax=Micromonospora sp. DT4 TaxID=3393438 RepID=UPI003CF992AC